MRGPHARHRSSDGALETLDLEPAIVSRCQVSLRRGCHILLECGIKEDGKDVFLVATRLAEAAFAEVKVGACCAVEATAANPRLTAVANMRGLERACWNGPGVKRRLLRGESRRGYLQGDKTANALTDEADKRVASTQESRGVP